MRARAIENVAYVAAADQGPPGYAGRSMVVDPFGVPVVLLAETEAVAIAELDRARLDRCRERMPSLEHRRWSVTPRPAAGSTR